MNECQRFSEMFVELNDGDADPDAAHEFQTHMQACPGCHDEYQLYGLTIRALNSLEPVSPPPEFLMQVSQRIDGRESASFFEQVKNWFSAAPYIPVPVGAAALAVIVVSSFFLYNQSVTPMNTDSGGETVTTTVNRGSNASGEDSTGWTKGPGLMGIQAKAIPKESSTRRALETPATNYPRYSNPSSGSIQTTLASTGPSYPTTADRIGADNLTVESPSMQSAIETVKQMVPRLQGRVVEFKPNPGVEEVLMGVVIPSRAYGDLTTRLIDFGALEAGAGGKVTPPKRSSSDGKNVMLYIRFVPRR